MADVERILSKQEIAELLTAVRDGEVDAYNPSAEEEYGLAGGSKKKSIRAAAVKRCELIRADGPEGWSLPNFDLMLDNFARNYAVTLSNRFQRSVAISLEGMESLPFELLLQKLSGKGAIGILQLEPLVGGGLLVVDEKLSFSLVEIVLGGSADQNVMIPNRAMSTIELNVIRDVLACSCPDLNKGFRQMEELNSSLIKVVSNLRLLNFVEPTDGVVAARFQIKIDTLEGVITLVVPHAALEPLQRKAQQKAVPVSTLQNTKWQQQIGEEIFDMEVSLEALLEKVSLRVRDILNLQVGDVIELDCSPDTPLRIQVEGRPKFYGMAGVQGGKKAIRIMGKKP